MIAFVIAGVSTGVSVISLIVSYRAYQRSGSKIEAYIARRRVKEYGEAYEWGSFHYEWELEITNKGMASIQILEWDLEFKGRLSWWLVRKDLITGRWSRASLTAEHMIDGPQLPCTLQGLHTLLWTVNKPLANDYDRKVRAAIRLGSGRSVKSNSLILIEWRNGRLLRPAAFRCQRGLDSRFPQAIKVVQH